MKLNPHLTTQNNIQLQIKHESKLFPLRRKQLFFLIEKLYHLELGKHFMNIQKIHIGEDGLCNEKLLLIKRHLKYTQRYARNWKKKIRGIAQVVEHLASKYPEFKP
jgi:hypothetical protein